MVTIHAPTSPIANCSACGVQRQFHFASGIPYSADRDHDFVPLTMADFEPAHLSPEQLAVEIFSHPNTPRAVACGDELRAQLRDNFGVSWDDLKEALA